MMKILVIFLLILMVEKSFSTTCRRNSQCSTGWCEGGGFFRKGRCASKITDGQSCYNNDRNSCASGRCTCGLCGYKQKGGAKCSSNADCFSNFCTKGYGCSGTCGESSDIDGGRWSLVRHVPAGNIWHKATDQLRGSMVYGTPCGATCGRAWSVRFDNRHFNQFLFATGDEKKWLITDRNAVLGGWYSNGLRSIAKSSTNPNPYRARWYRRAGALEDPWISLTDHFSAIRDGNILYGENNFGGAHASNILPKHKGANVFIRMKPHTTAPVPSPAPGSIVMMMEWPRWKYHMPGGVVTVGYMIGKFSKKCDNGRTVDPEVVLFYKPYSNYDVRNQFVETQHPCDQIKSRGRNAEFTDRNNVHWIAKWGPRYSSMCFPAGNQVTFKFFHEPSHTKKFGETTDWACCHFDSKTLNLQFDPYRTEICCQSYHQKCLEIDVNYYGHDLKSVPNIATWSQCGQLCQQTNNCQAWTWVTNTNRIYTNLHHTCYLKSSAAGRIKNDVTVGLLSGLRSCPAKVVARGNGVDYCNKPHPEETHNYYPQEAEI